LVLYRFQAAVEVLVLMGRQAQAALAVAVQAMDQIVTLEQVTQAHIPQRKVLMEDQQQEQTILAPAEAVQAVWELMQL
jgi:UDP-N-acetylmuramoylalanine-D-glutamate ligase